MPLGSVRGEPGRSGGGLVRNTGSVPGVGPDMERDTPSVNREPAARAQQTEHVSTTSPPRARPPRPERPPEQEPPLRLTRRGVLTLGALGAATVLGGGWAAWSAFSGPGFPVTTTPEVRDDPVPRPYTELQARTKVGSAAYVYEIDGKPTTYYVTPAFGTRLERWMALHVAETGQAPDRVHSYGAWAPGNDRSWHSSGEAFDLARLRLGGKDLASARYDQWRDDTAAEVRLRLRAYWRLAAGLHIEFADVLTYLFDSAHANHMHVDTGRFGPSGAPRLIRRSGAQVQAVQAMCVHVWGQSKVQVNGEFDSATRDATTRVIEENGGRGELSDGVEAWRAFMLATLRNEG